MCFGRPERPPPGLPLTASDSIPEEMFFNHVLVMGQSGSGKSSGPMDAIIRYLMARRAGGKNWGLFFTTVKPGDVHAALAYARAAGREGDVRLWGPETPFDFLMFDLTGPGASPQRAARNLAVALEMVSRVSKGGNSDPFWAMRAERILLIAITACWLSSGTASLADVQRFVTSLPATPDQANDAAWLAGSFCAQALRAAMNRKPGRDLDMVADFVGTEWPNLNPRTQSPAITSVLNITSQFLIGEMADVVSAGRLDVTPDDVLAGKIVIPTFPMLTFGAPGPGQWAQAIFKTLLQQRAQAREVTPETIPAAIVADEAHYSLVASADLMALTTCRGAKLAHICAAQGVPGCVAMLGGDGRAHAEFQGWAAQFQHKVFCSNTGETNDWASGLCGTHKEVLFSGNVSAEPYNPFDELLGGKPQASGGFSENVQPAFPPHLFGRLRTGTAVNAYEVEALVHASGRRFANGKPYLLASFFQRR
jgi:hypothetical protein